MPQVTSRDGTTIAYDRVGSGPLLVLVDGAMGYRGFGGYTSLARELAGSFTVITYDRRGRGESTDTRPYSVTREIEDIEALLDGSRPPVFLYGQSSGAALALLAAATLGDRISGLAMYEPPYGTDEDEKEEYARYTREIDDLVAAGRPGDAAARFLSDMLPAESIDEMRTSPTWPVIERVAPTLVYDNAVLGDGCIPTGTARSVSVPTLVLAGGGSMPFMRAAAEALALAIPDAGYRMLDGEDHQPAATVVAPVLASFFSSSS